MNLFHSTLIAFGTAGTGGFTYLNTSLATISLFNKYVVALFMFLFGVNFNIYFLIAIMKDVKTALKSEELRMYISLYITSTIFVFLNTYNMFSNISDALSGAVFHVSSFMTSTGYSVGDVNIYPTCCRIVILILMLISACAGSTCGGFKVSRLVICLKTIKRDLLKTIHPNSVRTIKFEGKTLDDETINATSTFLFLYVLLLCITMFLVSFDGRSLEVVTNAVFTTFANVGLAFKISNFAAFSSFAKIILSFGMLLGRLELFPLLVLLANIRTKIKY